MTQEADPQICDLLKKLEGFLDSLADIKSEWAEMLFPVPENENVAGKILEKLNEEGYDVYLIKGKEQENHSTIVLTTETM